MLKLKAAGSGQEFPGVSGGTASPAGSGTLRLLEGRAQVSHSSTSWLWRVADQQESPWLLKL